MTSFYLVKIWLYYTTILLFVLQFYCQEIKCGKYCDQCDQDGCILCDKNSLLDDETFQCYEQCQFGFYYDFDTETCTDICPQNTIANEDSLTCEKVGPCLQQGVFGDNLLFDQAIHFISFIPQQNFIIGAYNSENAIRIWDIQTKSLYLKLQVFNQTILNFAIVDQIQMQQNEMQISKINSYLIIWSQTSELVVFDLKTFSKIIFVNFEDICYQFSDETQIFTKMISQNILYLVLYEAKQGYVRLLKVQNGSIELINEIALENKLIKLYTENEENKLFIILKDTVFKISLLDDQTTQEQYLLCNNSQSFSQIIAIKSKSYFLSQLSDYIQLLFLVDKSQPLSFNIYSQNKCIQQLIFSEEILEIILLDQNSASGILIIVIDLQSINVIKVKSISQTLLHVMMPIFQLEDNNSNNIVTFEQHFRDSSSYSQYFAITYYTTQNKQISFVDLVVNSPDIDIKTNLDQIQTYNMSSYKLESECFKIAFNKYNSILAACANSKIFQKKLISITEPKIQSSQNGFALTNVLTFAESDVLVWFNKNYVEFYTYSSLEYLGNYQIEQADEFLVEFFQFTQIKQLALCTIYRILTFTISNKKIQFVSQSPRFVEINGWIGFSSLQLILGYGKIFKIQEVSVLIYSGVVIDYNNGNIILYGDQVNIFDFMGNLLIKQSFNPIVIKVVFSLEKLIFFNEISFSIFRRDQPEKLADGKFLGSLLGSVVMENKKQFCIYTTNIAYELFYIIDLNSGIKVGKQDINIQKQLIQDMKYDENSYSLIVAFQTNQIYLISVEKGIQVVQTYFHPQFLNSNLQINLKMYLDLRYGKLVVGFNYIIVIIDYNQSFETFNEIELIQNQDYALENNKQQSSLSSSFPSAYFLGQAGQIWKIEKNFTQLSNLFKYPQLLIKKIQVINQNLQINNVILVLFCEQNILFIDESGKIKLDLQLSYRESFQVEIQQQLEQNNICLFVLDDMNKVSILQVISFNIQTYFQQQLNCQQFQYHIYDLISSTIFLVCDSSTIFYIDLNYKNLEVQQIVLPSQIILIKSQGSFLYCCLKTGGVFIFQKLDQSNKFLQVQNLQTDTNINNEQHLQSQLTIKLFQVPFYQLNLQKGLFFISLPKFKTIEVYQLNNNINQSNQTLIIPPQKKILLASPNILDISVDMRYIYVVTTCQINLHDLFNFSLLNYFNINCKLQFRYFKLMDFQIFAVIYSNRTQIFQINQFDNKFIPLVDKNSNEIRILDLFYHKYQQGVYQNSVDKYILYTVFDDKHNIMLEGQYISQNLYFQESNNIKSFTKCTKVFEIKNNYYDFLNQLNTIQSYQNQNNRIILINLGQESSPYIYFLLQFNNKEITILGTQQTIITLENLTKSNDEITPNILVNNSTLFIPSDQNSVYFNQNIMKLSLKNLIVIGETKANTQGQILPYTYIQNSQIQYIYQQYIIIQNCTISNINVSRMQSLFFIKGAYNVIIKHLIIDDCILDDIFVLMHIQDTDYVQIENLSITNNQFFNISSFFLFENVTNLLFRQVSIINNYPKAQNSVLQQSQYLKNSYVLYFISTFYLKVDNLVAYSNVQLAIIYSQNYIELTNEIKFLQDDEVEFNNLVLEGNLYTSTSSDFSFVQMKGSFIKFISSRVQSNQCNQCNGTISLYKFVNITVQQSSFISNIAQNGGALFIKDTDLKFGLNISSSKFTSNVAHLSGGAIYLINSNVANIELTKFNLNRALIGGAIRQIGAYSALLFKKQSFLESNFVIFKENRGLSYGNDICAYPSKVLTHIKINNFYDIKQSNNKSIFFGNEIQEIKLRSGISLDVKVYFQDQQQQNLKIDYKNLSQYETQLLDQEYQNTIIYLKQDINDQNSYKIDGGTIISALKSYNFETKSFDFTNLIFTGTLQKCFKLQIQSLLINQDFLSFLEIGSQDGAFTICFDICKQGQIPILTSINEIVCRVCEEGSYSLYQMPNQYTFESIQKEDFKCQKCPLGSSSCQANEILLLDGYWRSNEQSDKIYSCNYLYNNCIGQKLNQKNYCAQGYLGPLCSSCDIFGEVWGNRYVLFHDMTCQICEKPSIQIILILIFIVTLSIICYLILYIIKQSIQKNCICQYLRYMKLLPLSHTQMSQRFSIIKCLINFLQISIVCNLKDGILPLNVIELFRNPLLFLIYKFDCFYPKNYKLKVMELRACMIGIFSIFFLIIMLTFQRESRKSLRNKKIHPFIYQILNFAIYFFSPQIIKYLIESIICFQVGDEEYLVIYSLQKCYVNGIGYGLFVNIVVIPSLVLIFLQPLILFYKIRKQRHTLDYLIIKYKYGFHYIEYNQKYFWWDLPRSYFKFVIILATSIINQQDDFQYFFLLIWATIYLNYQSKRTIFVNNYIQKLETISYTILILQFSIQYIQRIYTSYIYILNQIFFMVYLIFILICLLIILLNVEIKCFLKQKVKIWILVYTILNKFIPHKYLSLIFINKPRYQKSGLKPLLKWKYLLRQRSVIIQSKIDYLKCSKDNKQQRQNTSNFQTTYQQKQDQTNTNKSNDNIFIRKKKLLSNSINLESQLQSQQDWKHSINSSQITEHNFDFNKIKIQAVFSQNNSFQHSIFCPSSKIQQKNIADDELSNFDIQSEKSQKYSTNFNV
ncbi:hypothetical protein ABPG74_015679 [Tetrahymena malaccensis]